MLNVLLTLLIIFIAIKLASFLAIKFKQPKVLVELFIGVLVANTHLFAFIHELKFIEILAGLGVIMLLFEVGLESNLDEMQALGRESIMTACVGVILPFAAGYYVSGLLMPEISELTKVFIGATLTATSVGITARVFKDLNILKSAEARIVLGAAVIDDVLGLIILAVVSSLVSGEELSLTNITFISFKALFFLLSSIAAGRMAVDHGFKALAIFKIPTLIPVSALGFCALMSYFASLAGLAPIVGAFAAGLLLDPLHFEGFGSKQSVEDYIRPFTAFLVPLFFIVTGMQVNLTVFNYPDLVYIGLIITLVAMLGKILSGWAFKSKLAVSRLLIGIAMMPRGEVGLIFASTGLALGVLDDKLYAIAVMVVSLTTFLSPPLLSMVIKRNASRN